MERSSGGSAASSAACRTSVRRYHLLPTEQSVPSSDLDELEERAEVPLLQGHPQRAGCLQGLLRQAVPRWASPWPSRASSIWRRRVGADEKAAAPSRRSPPGTFGLVLGPGPIRPPWRPTWPAPATPIRGSPTGANSATRRRRSEQPIQHRSVWIHPVRRIPRPAWLRPRTTPDQPVVERRRQGSGTALRLPPPFRAPKGSCQSRSNVGMLGRPRPTLGAPRSPVGLALPQPITNCSVKMRAAERCLPRWPISRSPATTPWPVPRGRPVSLPWSAWSAPATCRTDRAALRRARPRW